MASNRQQQGPGSIFHRPDLAEKIAMQILRSSPTSASPSGLFLAAPRRTGKTTFMREDLAPALLAQRSAIVIYVDLWEDRRADPSDVIVAAVKHELAKHEPALAKLAKNFGIAGAKVVGLEFSLDRIGLGKEVSLSQALCALSDASKKTIVLIIDEAQQAITTDAGNDAMFALKAARDELNTVQHFGLRVVCSGSNRDKLAMLRNSKDQAFFGAPLIPFPPLGKDYAEWFCRHTDDLPAPLDPELVFPLFVRAGHRPEILGAAADQLRFDFELEAGQVSQRFVAAVDAQIQAGNEDALQVVRSLTPIQSAVLHVMAASGANFAPFEAATLEKYRLATQRAGATNVNVEVNSVQQALIALQEKGLVWRAARGVYAMEDGSLTELLGVQV